ncbi:hypothetical protein WMF04_27330 [Sorangium sp. So ce260]|uniref:hypothetical protein n=1 Tax=Sorangium sp. So ce260 TaxID=3133291 RepID=UPI003F61B6AA
MTAHRPAPSAGKVDVFNLTIDGPERNYFAEGLLVHNKPRAGCELDGYLEQLDCDDVDPSVSP